MLWLAQADKDFSIQVDVLKSNEGRGFFLALMDVWSKLT